jgi:hypothetical protein
VLDIFSLAEVLINRAARPNTCIQKWHNISHVLVCGTRLWNTVPTDLRQSETIYEHFKRLLKTVLFRDHGALIVTCWYMRLQILLLTELLICSIYIITNGRVFHSIWSHVKPHDPESNTTELMYNRTCHTISHVLDKFSHVVQYLFNIFTRETTQSHVQLDSTHVFSDKT